MNPNYHRRAFDFYWQAMGGELENSGNRLRIAVHFALEACGPLDWGVWLR